MRERERGGEREGDVSERLSLSLSRFFYIKAISCSNCPSGGEHEREWEREREFVALVATFSDELPK